MAHSTLGLEIKIELRFCATNVISVSRKDNQHVILFDDERRFQLQLETHENI